MKFVKNLALFVSALCVVKVLAAALLILLSTPPMLFELSASETELRATYEILMGYFFVVVILLLVTSVSLFNQATKKNAFQLNFVLTAISLLIYGAHLILGVVGDPGKSLLVQAAQGSIWVPILASFAVLTSYLISRSQPA